MWQSWLARSVHRSPRIVVALVDAWPELPEAIKAGIVAMVKAASERDGRVVSLRNSRTDRTQPDPRRWR